VQRAGQRADGRAHGGQRVGAGGRDDACRERRRVHAVLGGGDPVRVDRPSVGGVGLAPPGQQEALGERAALVDRGLRDRRQVGPSCGLGGEGQQRRGRAGERVARRGGIDVDERLHAPDRREEGERRLQVGARVAGSHG
jgi:hypothetical protein